MSPLKDQKKNNAVIAIVIFLVLGAVTAGAFLLPRVMDALNPGLSVKVNVPLIRSTLTSKSDGQSQTVQTVFTVEMNRAARARFNNTQLEEALTEIMQEMDLDELQAAGGIAYLTQAATEQLNARLATDEESEVYVRDFMIGEMVQLAEPPDPREDIIRGLFGGDG